MYTRSNELATFELDCDDFFSYGGIQFFQSPRTMFTHHSFQVTAQTNCKGSDQRNKHSYALRSSALGTSSSSCSVCSDAFLLKPSFPFLTVATLGGDELGNRPGPRPYRGLAHTRASRLQWSLACTGLALAGSAVIACHCSDFFILYMSPPYSVKNWDRKRLSPQNPVLSTPSVMFRP